MYRKHLLAAAVLMALCLILPLRPAFASVGLVYFKAEAHSANTILLSWETATESGTIGFRVFRAATQSPTSWGDPITSPEAKGNAVIGGQYTYEDTVTPGVTYYYLLREVSSGGVSDVATTSAGIGVVTNTPTATGTASVTPSATRTQQPVSSGPNPIATFTKPPPTATRQYTNTPAVSPLGTATLQIPTAVPLRTPTPTPLPPASVASPTGRAPEVTVPPTLTPAAAQLVTTTPLEPATITPTVDVVSTEEGPAETATPRPTKDVTPIIFAAETTPGSGSPTPANSEDVAGQGGRSGTLALMAGGGALGLAGLLAAVFLFLRSRKS